MSAYTILHAEDDENEAILLAYSFRKEANRYTIQQVGDGETAVEYLRGVGDFGNRAKHPLPAAVLLDLKMPRKNGFEVLEWLRTQPELYQLPVIVLSSSEQPEDKARALRLGANAYVTKSLDWSAVLTTVRSILV